MATTLILIRHGSTGWNRQKRYCGFKDVGLSALGKMQSRRVRKKIGLNPIKQVYTSDRKRAIQTARIIFSDKPITRIKGLKEINFGIFEGLTHKQIIKKYPLIYSRWLKDPFCNCIPKGESLKNFQKRVVAAFKKIIALNPHETSAVVCHGGVISVYVNHIRKQKKFWETIPKAASLSIIKKHKRSVRVKQFNDTSHLAGT